MTQPPQPPPPSEVSNSPDTATRLALLAADHAHAETMQKGELGWLGKCLGGEKSAPTSIAFVAICIGSLIAVSSLIGAIVNINPDFNFMSTFERSIAFVSACLAFVFGRGTRPSN